MSKREQRVTLALKWHYLDHLNPDEIQEPDLPGQVPPPGVHRRADRRACRRRDHLDSLPDGGGSNNGTVCAHK